ncbi:MAG: malto-oligosyltrehalose trehalohydrolase [Planctomycetaceae bacterium]
MPLDMSLAAGRPRELSHRYRRLGAIVESDGVQFCVWAPGAENVEVVLEHSEERLSLQPAGDGYFERFVAGLGALATYRFSIDGGDPLPDPASRFQPRGVHASSQVIDPAAYRWRDQAWRGIDQKDLVFYELHVGTFTGEGTYRAAEQKLPYLKDLGVTAIELLPLAEFPGRWNWGYDPAAMYAPYHGYGTPDDLRHFIDAAHQSGIAVFLDVIYNHFGPDGSYAAVFGHFFSDKHSSPWGKGINLDDRDSEGVRSFFIDNALHWLREYHFDGLRLDATHALQDDSQVHFLAELSSAVEVSLDRKRYLIAEDERNLAKLARPRSLQGYGLDAIWADDFHHQIRNLTAGDVEAYFADFANSTAKQIAATLRQGWYYTGQPAISLGGPRGTATDGLQPSQFVICIQNHDQVGNRPLGDRLHHCISPATYRAVSSLLLFAPQLPLLFMGQEWSTSTPFQFFTDHHEELGRLVTAGRRNEFNRFKGFAGGMVPDPQDPATFERSKLNWDEITQPPHQGVLRLYQDLLKIRPKLGSHVEVGAHGDRGLWLQRGAYLLLVALADDLHLPLAPDWVVMLQSEDHRYAIDGHPAERVGKEIHFSRAGAVVCRRAGDAS